MPVRRIRIWSIVKKVNHFKPMVVSHLDIRVVSLIRLIFFTGDGCGYLHFLTVSIKIK